VKDKTLPMQNVGEGLPDMLSWCPPSYMYRMWVHIVLGGVWSWLHQSHSCCPNSTPHIWQEGSQKKHKPPCVKCTGGAVNENEKIK
jgi:hypothetical protein